MNDTPPTSDKKPRRRGAPRKRAPAKAAAKTATTTIGEGDGDAPAKAGTRASGKPGRPRGAATNATPVRALADATALENPGPGAAGSNESHGNSPAIAAKVSGGAAQSTPAPADDLGAAVPAASHGVAADTSDAAPDSPTARDDAATAQSAPAPVDGSRRAPDAAAGASGTDHAAPVSTRADARSVPAPETPPRPVREGQAQRRGAASGDELRQASLRPGELIRVPLSVRWRDLDAFNHVNNSKYLSYLEEARLRWMLTIPGMGLDDDVAPVVAASNLNYRRPIGWPGDVVIELFVERLGNTSVTIGHRIVDASEGGVTYCDGHVVMVWIDRTSGRAAPLPDAVRASCARR